MKLNILANRDVGGAARIHLRKVGHSAELVGIHKAVPEPDARHEIGHSVTLAGRAADGARTIALRIDPPPPEIGLDPGLGNRGITPGSEGANLVETLPRILFTLESLRPLGFGFRQCLCRRAHGSNPNFL